MQQPLTHIPAPSRIERASIAPLLRVLKNLTITTLVAFLIGASFILPASGTLSGQVISANTKKPVEGALVYIHFEMSNNEDGLNSYVTSDKDGKFSVSGVGKIAVIRVWKPGYALRALRTAHAQELWQREVFVELRELTSNLVTEHDNFFNFSHGSGFSFKLGRSVHGQSRDADIVILGDLVDKTVGYIEARGDAGIYFQPWDEKTDFYNSPEAPDDGYAKRLRLIRPQEGHYFIRTSDGKHYGKLRLLVDLVHPSNGPPFLDLEHSQLLWAYQPNGTRQLDIEPSKSLPFPVEEFGFKRESLGLKDH